MHSKLFRIFNSNTIKGSVVWSVFCHGLIAVNQLVILYILVLNNDLELLGYYTLSFSIITPIIVTFAMDMRQLIMSDYNNKNRFHEYFYQRVFSLLISFLIYLIIISIIKIHFEIYIIFVFLFIAKSIELISDIFYSFAYKNKHTELVALSTFFRFLLSILVFSISILQFRSLFLGSLLLLLVNIVCLIIFDLNIISKSLSLKFDKLTSDTIKEMWNITYKLMPLALSSGFNSLTLNIPRYFLFNILGTSSVAIYSVAAIPVNILNMAFYSIYQGYIPHLIEKYNKPDKNEFFKTGWVLSCVLFLIMILLSSITYFIGDYIIIHILSSEYLILREVIIVIFAGMSVSQISAVGSFIILIEQKYWVTFAIIFISLILSIGISYFLITSENLLGAALAESSKYVVAGILYLFITIKFKNNL